MLECTNDRSLNCSNQTKHNISPQLNTLNRPHKSDASNKREEEPGLLGCDAVLLGVQFPMYLHFQGHCISHHHNTEELHLQQHHSKNHITHLATNVVSLCYEHCYLPEVLGYVQIYCMYEQSICASCAPLCTYYRTPQLLQNYPYTVANMQHSHSYQYNMQVLLHATVYGCYLNLNFNFLLLSMLLFLNQCVISSSKSKKVYR